MKPTKKELEDKKRRNEALCQKAWDFLVAHPYLNNRAAAAQVGVTPWVFTGWAAKYHSGELDRIRTKVGLPLKTGVGSGVETFHLFRITARDAHKPGRTLVWDRYVSADTKEDARKRLDLQLANTGITPLAVECITDIPGKVSELVEGEARP